MFTSPLQKYYFEPFSTPPPPHPSPSNEPLSLLYVHYTELLLSSQVEQWWCSLPLLQSHSATGRQLQSATAFRITIIRALSPVAIGTVTTHAKIMFLRSKRNQPWGKLCQCTHKYIYPTKTRFKDSNKSPTRCNNFPVHHPDVYLQLNTFRAFSPPSSGARLQWQPLVLPSYRGDSRAVVRGWAGQPVLLFVVGPAGPTTKNSTAITTIRR